MMRYQGPDNLPLSNGRKSHWRSCKEDENMLGNSEIDEENDATKTIPNFVEVPKGVPKFRSSSSKTTQDHNFSPFSGSFPNPLQKDKEPQNQELNNTTTPLQSVGGSGDMLLQWGHRKRSRISRSTDTRSATVAGATNGGGGGSMADESSSSSSTQVQGMMKVPRRSITLPTPATTFAGVIDTKNSNIMPPPSSILPNTISITNSSTSNAKVGIHKSSSKDNSAFVNRRNLEERSGGGSGSHPPRNGSSSRAANISGSTTTAGGVAAGSSSRSKLVKRSPQKVIEKNDQRKTISTTTACSSGSALLKSDEKINGLRNQELQETGGFGINQHQNISSSASPQEAAGCSTNTTNNNHNHNHDDISTTKTATTAAANGGGEVYEWPRVHIPLTRKEKEEDFLLMKGTKLPHRPKKRPKTVDRMLQYCFPGTWLCDVTKARYEVKEKKCTTKKPKRRGLKGMESVETDSE